MSDDKFDSIVVGAGPAGVSAAITMARAGLNVALLERGEYAGAKNVQGAVLYSKMLADVIPEFWKDCPLERSIVEERVFVLTEKTGIQIGFKSGEVEADPANCYTIIRTQFDRWFAKKAEEAGVTLLTGVTISDIIKKDGVVVGVKSTEGDELFADVIIACDGANSIIGPESGHCEREWKSDEVALGVKEVLSLPREKLKTAFVLKAIKARRSKWSVISQKGCWATRFMYTNKESIALGLGCALDDFQRTNIKPYELLEQLKRHPLVRPL